MVKTKKKVSEYSLAQVGLGVLVLVGHRETKPQGKRNQKINPQEGGGKQT